jgi:hypothetical protein
VNTTTLAKTGKSLARLLSLPDEELDIYKNQWVYFSSFCVSQGGVLESVIRATGTAENDWTIETVSAVEEAEKAKEAVVNGDRMKAIILPFRYLVQKRIRWGLE